MDIYVLHDGKEIGPLAAEKTWQLLNQGSIAADDLAWTPGMGKWEPLSGILPPAEDLQPAPPPAPVENTLLETSTAKQRALLAFLHIGFTRSTSKQEAALLISDALENPAYATRLAQWPTERLKLHGDLFVAELQARRDNRAHHYQMLAQSEGAALFSGVTKAHAQSVITHLDLESPNWEGNEATAAREHFFPALAEKFPQLVRPEAHGQLNAPGARTSAPESSASPAKKTRSKERRAGFPTAALIRGLLFGALVLGIGWFVMNVLQGGKSPSATTASSTVPNTPAPAEPTAAPEATPAPAIPSAAEEKPPAPEPTPPAVAGTPAPMAENVAPSAPATPPVASQNPPPSPTTSPTAPTALVLTKPFAAKLTYGSMTLPAGTALKLISQDGALLRVQYLNDTFLVPASSTNHPTAPAATPGL